MGKRLTEGEIITSFKLKHGNKYQYPPFPKPFNTKSRITTQLTQT